MKPTKLCPKTVSGKHMWYRDPYQDYPRCSVCEMVDDTYVLTEEEKKRQGELRDQLNKQIDKWESTLLNPTC